MSDPWLDLTSLGEDTLLRSAGRIRPLPAPLSLEAAGRHEEIIMKESTHGSVGSLFVNYQRLPATNKENSSKATSQRRSVRGSLLAGWLGPAFEGASTEHV